MKKILLLLAFLSITGSRLLAQAPQGINYQGIARAASGDAISSSPISLRLTILNSSSTAVYQETQSVTTNAFGLYWVVIGQGTVVTGTFSTIDWSAGGYSLMTEMDPTGGTSYTTLGTSAMQTVPYSFYANNAAMAGDVTGTSNANTISKLQGKPVSAAAPAIGAVLKWNGTDWIAATGYLSSTGTANYIPVFNSATTLANSSIYQSGTMYGIGTTTPAAGLQVGSATDSMITYMATSTASAPTQHGTAEIDYAGITDGVIGFRGNSYNVISNHATAGVEGIGTGEGVLGVGISGYTSGGSTNQRGLEGDAYGNDLPMGVAGFSNVYDTTPNFSIGIYGSASGGLANYAGYFNGDIYVSGTVYGTVKAFKIDDPLDPGNKYLIHSCVESDQMVTVYSGNVTTDADGIANVTLPAYFEALNTDPRYQLTVLGQFAQAIVSKKVSGNQFQIKTNQPNVEVSWQVTGVRHDAAATAHPMSNEVAKEPFNKGKYLDAAAYSQPADKKIGAEMNQPHGNKNVPTSISSVPGAK